MGRCEFVIGAENSGWGAEVAYRLVVDCQLCKGVEGQEDVAHARLHGEEANV